ncbi:MAG: hypothetical protein L6Q77_01115 [Bacteroidetes bacterium]|nr:hypothetical protein [Bacteroidota bacterium]
MSGPANSAYLFSLHGFSGAYLDHTGYNPVFSEGMTNPAYSNPAAAASTGKFQIWTKWTGNSEIKDAWFGFDYRQRIPEIPSGIGIAFPVCGLVVSGGFSRVLNTSIFDEGIPRSIQGNPSETGDKFGVYINGRQDIYSASLSKKFNFSNSDGTFLAVGVSVKYSKVSVETTVLENVESGRDNSVAAGFGAIYSGMDPDGRSFRVGLSFEPREVHKGSLTGHPEYYYDLTGSGFYPAGFKTYLPHRFHGGIELNSQNGIRNSVQGSLFLGEGSGFMNTNQYSLAASTQVPVLDFLSVSGGVLWDSWRSNSDMDGNPAKNSDFKSVFLTAGLSARFYGFSLSLALADNRFYSGEPRKQTLITAGINYGFNLEDK